MIINCAPEVCPNWFLNDIDYKWIYIPDPLLEKPTSASQIECLIYETTDLLLKYLSENYAVMFHCADYDGKTGLAGSRSATMLIGVIMVSLNISFDEAYKIINKKWPITVP